MASVGPFEPAARMAVAVSGGPDSMALALLTDAWARERGGSVLALIVDHRLRAESAAEAKQAAMRLAGRGISARVLTLDGLERGPALAERAREARFSVLARACGQADILHLLLGHHAGDQAETVLIRALGGSGDRGMAAMAPLVEMAGLRVLRPLLHVPPERLRAVLVELDVGWAEDPSNQDPSALRPRLRSLRRDRGGTGSATAALVVAARALGGARAETDKRVAVELAEHALLRPEGFAVISPGSISPAALATLFQVIAGAPFPPPTAAIASLATRPQAATLAGVRLLPAGRLGPGMLIAREAVAMQPAIEARPGAVWDGRFRVARRAALPPGTTLGALGAEAARLRGYSRLPSAVLQTLPAFRRDGMLLGVPHLRYPSADICTACPVIFSPPRPAAGAPFAFRDASKLESPYLDVA